MSVAVTRLSPSAPAHWLAVIADHAIAPGDAIALTDDTTGARTPQTGRIVRLTVGLDDAAGGAAEAIPVLATTEASPALLSTVLTLDPIADGASTDQAVDPPIPYATLPDGPLYLHPGLDAGTATLTARLLILGAWAP